MVKTHMNEEEQKRISTIENKINMTDEEMFTSLRYMNIDKKDNPLEFEKEYIELINFILYFEQRLSNLLVVTEPNTNKHDHVLNSIKITSDLLNEYRQTLLSEYTTNQVVAYLTLINLKLIDAKENDTYQQKQYKYMGHVKAIKEYLESKMNEYGDHSYMYSDTLQYVSLAIDILNDEEMFKENKSIIK